MLGVVLRQVSSMAECLKGLYGVYMLETFLKVQDGYTKCNGYEKQQPKLL